jgi:putative endonuclease
VTGKRSGSRGPACATGALGRYGEDVAVRCLEAAGMRVLERNWRCRHGEIDIVALDADGDVLVVCEVKTRSGTRYQHPLAGVGERKAERLRRLAELWLVERWPRFDRRAGPPGGVRLDVVAVVRGRRGAAGVEHVRGAV